MLFAELDLVPPLLQAVTDLGYHNPTPIQEQAIPHVLEGRDVLGCAQTGTGKTAAFALPILQRLMETPPRGPGKRPIRVLVLAPTHELASQIGESFGEYGVHTSLRHTVIFGGVGQGNQTRALEKGVDVLVATPGRLLDLMGQGYVSLRGVEVLVLDEADRMLDMGFIPDIRRIVATLPVDRQTLLFSATLPDSILHLASGILCEPVRVSVTPPATTLESIEQSVFVVEKPDKTALLIHLLGQDEITRALVFTRTKHGADRVVRHLHRASIHAGAIHGDKSQGQREAALEDFKRGRSRVLVATDIASRGLDIDDVSHVVNFDLPNEPEVYVHRIGRTGRAGACGKALSFCAVEERDHLVAIEKLIRKRIPLEKEHPFPSRIPISIGLHGEHDAPGASVARPPSIGRPRTGRTFGRLGRR
jgi:ATP-dependent RNA helicase RhlE